MKFLRRLLGVVTNIYNTLGPVIDLLLKYDVTQMNEDDRYAFGVCAAEFKQAGAALTEVGNTLDEIKNGNITAEEYKALGEKLYKALDEVQDLGPAVKGLF